MDMTREQLAAITGLQLTEEQFQALSADMAAEGATKKAKREALASVVKAEIAEHGEEYVIEKYNLRAFYASLGGTPEETSHEWWAHDAAEALEMRGAT